MKTSKGSQAGTLRGGGGVVQRLKAVAESAADPPEVKLERPVCGSASAAPDTPSFNPPSFLSLAMCLGVAAAAVVVAAVVLMALTFAGETVFFFAVACACLPDLPGAPCSLCPAIN